MEYMAQKMDDLITGAQLNDCSEVTEVPTKYLRKLEHKVSYYESSLTQAQESLASWILPDSGITDETLLSELLGILDAQDLVKLMRGK